MSNRIALVIGNTNYAQGPLKNPLNDAALITARLQKLGFEIVGGASSARHPTGLDAGANPTWQKTFGLIQQFMAKIEMGSIALIYYAGHALQVGDQNFLMPVDADLSPGKPDLGLVKIKPLIEQAAGRAGNDGTVVAFLDACRDNPLDEEQQCAILGIRHEVAPVEHGQREPAVLTRGGLATMKMDRQTQRARTFIGFASAPGDVAYDGKKGNSNSPFAAALDRHLATRGLEIEEFYNRVAKDVLDQIDTELGRYQDPWEETNLNRSFFLHPRSTMPILAMGLSGLVVGLVVSALLFTGGNIARPPPPWMWSLGGLFGLIGAWGTVQWGSGKWQDAIFAFLGPVFGFAVALAVLMMIPAYPSSVELTRPTPEREVASYVFGLATLLGMAVYIVGIVLVRLKQNEPWPATVLGWFNRLMTWVLPAMVAGTLLALDYLLSFANPYYTAITLCALLAGILYAAGTELGCRPQLGLFRQFGPFTGAVSVGLLMAVLFAVFAWLTFRYKLDGNQLQMMMVGFGGLWHALLGAQLGYCFAYYVPDHKKWAP